jgi:hypothetical protein
MITVALVSMLLGCDKKEPEIPAAPSGNGSTVAPRRDRSPNHVRSGGPAGVRRVVVIEGTLTRSADGSEEIIITGRGYRYTLRRMPGCNVIQTRAPRNQSPADVIHSDCLEFGLARLLVAQAIREKPDANNATLRQWLRTPGGQMTTEFQRWPDRDVAKMIEICRRVGRSKFISGDFPRPPRRQPVRKRNRQRRYRFRGMYRGRVFEAQSIERA